MPSKYLPGGSGFNGMTGAAAHFDEASGMWIDTAGQQIRDDAITSTPGSGSGGGSPSSGGGADMGTAAPSTSTMGAMGPQAPSPAVAGLDAAMGGGGGSQAGGDGYLGVGQSSVRQGIGQRNLPMEGLVLARRMY